MKPGSKNSYSSWSDLEIGGKKYKYYSIKAAENNGLDGVSKLPKSLKVLLEKLLFLFIKWSWKKWLRWY